MLELSSALVKILRHDQAHPPIDLSAESRRSDVRIDSAARPDPHGDRADAGPLGSGARNPAVRVPIGRKPVWERAFHASEVGGSSRFYGHGLGDHVRHDRGSSGTCVSRVSVTAAAVLSAAPAAMVFAAPAVATAVAASAAAAASQTF
jgi:hypothetical protein